MRDHDPLERMIVPRLASHPRQENGSCKDLERERRDLERLGFLMRERLVLADTGRLNYLVLIGASELLPKLLTRPGRRRRFAPNCAIIAVRMAEPPEWVEVRPVPGTALDEPLHRATDRGNGPPSQLARVIGADLVLIDDRAAVVAARGFGCAVIGTLGVAPRAERCRRSLPEA